MTCVAARLQEGGWEDWLLWQRAIAAHRTAPSEEAGAHEPVLTMLDADQGESVTFALVTARTVA